MIHGLHPVSSLVQITVGVIVFSLLIQTGLDGLCLSPSPLTLAAKFRGCCRDDLEGASLLWTLLLASRSSPHVNHLDQRKVVSD